MTIATVWCPSRRSRGREAPPHNSTLPAQCRSDRHRRPRDLKRVGNSCRMMRKRTTMRIMRTMMTTMRTITTTLRSKIRMRRQRRPVLRAKRDRRSVAAFQSLSRSHPLCPLRSSFPTTYASIKPPQPNSKKKRRSTMMSKSRTRKMMMMQGKLNKSSSRCLSKLRFSSNKCPNNSCTLCPRSPTRTQPTKTSFSNRRSTKKIANSNINNSWKRRRRKTTSSNTL